MCIRPPRLAGDGGRYGAILSGAAARRGSELDRPLCRCHAGRRLDQQQRVTEAVGATFCNPAIAGCTAGPAASGALAAAVPGTFSTSHSGAIGGGEFGYNWQLGPVVLGFEADISGSTLTGGTLISGASAVSGFPANTVAVSASANAKVDYLGTVRGRAGGLSPDASVPYLCDRRLGLRWRLVEHDVGRECRWTVRVRGTSRQFMDQLRGRVSVGSLAAASSTCWLRTGRSRRSTCTTTSGA